MRGMFLCVRACGVPGRSRWHRRRAGAGAPGRGAVCGVCGTVSCLCGVAVCDVCGMGRAPDADACLLAHPIRT